MFRGMPAVFTSQGLTKVFGTRTLFEGVSLSLEERERLALIGPNGSGKSTLLKILSGQERADAGSVTLRKGVRMAYVAQKDTFPEGSTVLSAVSDDLHAALKAGQIPHMHDDHEADLAAEMAVDRADFADHSTPTRVLSGGQRKRLAIVRELAKEPDVLLLDEPTNHLDLEGIQWLEGVLRGGPFASIVITHDREFLETIAMRIAELSRQYPSGIFAINGNYTEFLRRKTEFLDGQLKAEQSLASQVREDLRWLSRGAKARRTKSKSRIDASHERIDELAALRARNAEAKATTIDWGSTGRLTHKLLVARAITKSLGDRRLFTDVDLILSPGQVLGLLGPNGSGKSTLIKVLVGELEPDPPTPEALKEAAEHPNPPPGLPPPGTVQRAEKLRIVVFSQHRTEIDPGMTLGQALSPNSDAVIYRGSTLHVNTWARKFLFSPQQLKQPVRSLSGGEQARIHIARLMLEPADLLILDEPTNDLDIPSLEVLEESLEEFPGAAVLVTHDRAMLARLSTSILALDGKGGARHYVDYDQWMNAQREAARGGAKTAKASFDSRGGGTPTPPPTPPAPKKQKLSYKEQRELAEIQGVIQREEAVVAEFTEKLADPSVSGEARKLRDVSEKLAAAQAKVAALYARWEELEARA